MKSVLTLTVAAIALAASGCTPVPPTIEDKCAMAVAPQAGVSPKEITTKGTVATSVGPKIYVVAKGATYTCQGDTAGNIGAVELQG